MILLLPGCSASTSEPPTANIKPTPVVATASKQPVNPGNKPTPRASIRPMITPATVPTPTPTATVMPTTQVETQERKYLLKKKDKNVSKCKSKFVSFFMFFLSHHSILESHFLCSHAVQRWPAGGACDRVRQRQRLGPLGQPQRPDHSGQPHDDRAADPDSGHGVCPAHPAAEREPRRAGQSGNTVCSHRSHAQLTGGVALHVLHLVCVWNR